MNIGLFRLRPLLKELRGIRAELARANAIRELELAYQGVHVVAPKADTSGPDPQISYTDEEADALRELQEDLGKVGIPSEQED